MTWKPAFAAPALLVIVAFGPCGRIRPPGKPTPTARVDTVITTRQVVSPVPLPNGTTIELCLSTGFSLPVLIAENGDTLIGQSRVSIKQLRPGFVFEGGYAERKTWLARGDSIRFENRVYRKTGAPQVWKCDDLKQIGLYDGVPLFAELTAPPPLQIILVPIRPGTFQAYHTTAARRR